MSAEALAGAKLLKVEVWDWDMGPQSDDFIGGATFELPDLQAMLAAGQHRLDLPSLLLADPKAKAGSKSRGSIEDSYSLLERPGGAMSTASLGGGGDKERVIAQLRADLAERDREISRLRAQLGGAGPSAEPRLASAPAGGAGGVTAEPLPTRAPPGAVRSGSANPNP